MQADYRAADRAWARELADALLAHFEDREAGGVFFTSHDHEMLLTRPKPGYDHATPSGNGVAVYALRRLGADDPMLALPNGLDLPPALDKPESDQAVAWICSGSSCRPPVIRLADWLDRDEKTTLGNDVRDARSDPA